MGNKHTELAEEHWKKMSKIKKNDKFSELRPLQKILAEAQNLVEETEEKIHALKLPNTIESFVKNYPDCMIMESTKTGCRIEVVSDHIKQMPHGATDITVEDNKIKFHVVD